MKNKTLLIIVAVFLFAMTVNAQEVTFQDPITVECGDIIEGEFSENYENHQYSIALAPGDAINFYTISFGPSLTMTTFLLGPTNLAIQVNDGFLYNNGNMRFRALEAQPRINTEPLPARGTYTIGVTNYGLSSGDPQNSGGVGVYTLYIGCTPRDAPSIAPGESADGSAPSADDVGAVVDSFSGFGFPGILPVDFSSGVELPLTAGQPALTPMAGDLVALYTYEAEAGSTGTLNVSRSTGDVSVGVTVIHRETNELVFLSGMPASDNLSVNLTFEAGGTYAIGLFQLQTGGAETSGAVQVSIE